MTHKPAAIVWEITLFGGLAVRDGKGRAVEVPGRKDRALLGFLAAAPGIPHSRERLAALLWGDSGERQARDSLKQAVFRLRRAFAEAGEAVLVTDRQTVALAAASVAVDVGRFERLLEDGSAEALEKALALYGGELLEGVTLPDAAFEDWLWAERQRLRGLAVEAATGLMTEAVAARRWDRAATAARRLLTLEPLHEAACRTLMQMHAARGERAQALRLFDNLRQRLRRDLAVAPEPETLALYQELRERRGFEAASSGSRPAEPGGTLGTPQPDQVRISAQPAFAGRWLIRRLDRFRDAWPDCEVVLDATSRLADLERDEADLAIRRSPGCRAGLAQDLLVCSRVYPVAAPGLLSPDPLPPRAALGATLEPRALLDLPLLHDDDGSLWQSWLAAAGLAGAEPPRGTRILETGLAIDAALAGQGVVLADLFLIADDLRAGRLMKLCDLAVPDWDYYLVHRDGARQDRAVHRFRDWLLRDTEPLRRNSFKFSLQG